MELNIRSRHDNDMNLHASNKATHQCIRQSRPTGFVHKVRRLLFLEDLQSMPLITFCQVYREALPGRTGTRAHGHPGTPPIHGHTGTRAPGQAPTEDCSRIFQEKLHLLHQRDCPEKLVPKTSQTESKRWAKGHTWEKVLCWSLEWFSFCTALCPSMLGFRSLRSEAN